MPNTEALTQLRRVVEAAPEELFHMRAVVEHVDCGTARCALGWAIIDPWFQANTRINEALPADYDRQMYLGYRTERVLCEIFDIDEKDTRYLFAAHLSVYVDPHAVPRRTVLANIDRLLAGKRAVKYKATLA